MKKLLKYYFMIVGFLTTVFVVLFIVFMFKVVDNIGKISPHLVEREKVLPDQPHYLELDLVGRVADREISELTEFFQFLEGEQEYRLYDLITTLDKASKDERIKGLVIKRLGLEADLNSMIELSDAFLRFRERGKKIYIFLSEVDNKNYLLASAADKIFIQEEGSLYVPGISASLFYIKDLLAKVGIEAEFLKTGRFKSAPEVFTENAMSHDTRSMTTNLLKDIHETFITTIAGNRKLDKEEVIDFVDKALITAKEALQRRLVDVLADSDDFQKAVEEKFFPKVESVDFDIYARLSPRSIKGMKVDTRNKIGLIVASGPIQMYSSRSQFDESLILPHKITKKLKEAAEDNSIKALILRVNSPGGSALASDIIWKAVNNLNDIKKPVFVSMGSMAASGGYYISMGAKRLFAGKTTITGSIGVFGGKFVVGSLLDKIGAHSESITFSEGASMFSPESNFTPQQRGYFQEYLDDTYHSFVTKASLSRKRSYEELDRVAQGRVWSGRQAKGVGLIDEVGGYYEVIQGVKDHLGLGKEVTPTIIPIKISSDSLLERFQSVYFSLKERLSLSLEAELTKRIAKIKMFEDLMLQEKALYLMPYMIEIQ